jgi:sugar/nucleoside kinase (ribokinase family)
VFIIVSATSGERTAFLLNGDNPQHLTESQRKAIAASSLVYYDGSWPEVFPCVREICDSRSIPMSCNLDVDSESSMEMFGSAEVGVASASACLAEETSDMSRVEDWLLNNWSVRRKLLVLTAGSGGSWAFDGDRMHYVHPPVGRIVDVTGAGDAYHAGIVYGVLADWPVRETLELATSLGVLQCSHLGSNLGCLGEDQVREGTGITIRQTETSD